MSTESAPQSVPYWKTRYFTHAWRKELVFAALDQPESFYY